MVKKILSVALCVAVLVFIYAPILLLVVYSFTDAKIIGQWKGFSFGLYAQLFRDAEIMRILLNTVWLALAAAVLSTALGTAGAIGIFYSRRRVSKPLQAVSQIPVINAEIVTAISLALLFSMVLLYRTYFSLLVGHMVLCTPFVVLSVLPKLKQMDPNTYEAALDLGASPTYALFRIVIPQIFSGILSGFMLSVTLSLDDYIVTAFTKPKTFDTISTYVYNAVKNGGTSYDKPADGYYVNTDGRRIGTQQVYYGIQVSSGRITAIFRARTPETVLPTITLVISISEVSTNRYQVSFSLTASVVPSERVTVTISALQLRKTQGGASQAGQFQNTNGTVFNGRTLTIGGSGIPAIVAPVTLITSLATPFWVTATATCDSGNYRFVNNGGNTDEGPGEIIP